MGMLEDVQDAVSLFRRVRLTREELAERAGFNQSTALHIERSCDANAIGNHRVKTLETYIDAVHIAIRGKHQALTNLVAEIDEGRK